MRGYARSNRTIVFSTHYLEEADDNADRIVVIAGGRTIADGTSDEIKKVVAGRTVSFDLIGTSAGLDRLPGVIAVEIRGDRAHLSTTDSDATVVALAGAGLVRDLEVVGAGLEEAFMTLTGGRR
jgi:ABC-2 type transport system ATP-binding protein